MLLIPRRQSGVPAPLGPGLPNWRNPSAKGLLRAYPLVSRPVDSTNRGQAIVVSGTQQVVTQQGKVTKFNGTSDYIQLPTANMVGGYPLTVSLWFYKDPSITPAGVMVSLNGANYHLLAGFLTGNLIFGLSASPSYLGILAANVPAGWNHLVHTAYSGANVTYLNTVLAPQGNAGNSWGEPAAGNHSIGNRLNGSSPQFYNGLLSNVLLFDRALSAQEVQSLYSDQWQSISASDDYIYVPVSSGAPAGAELAGNAQAQATATGNLTLQASLDAVALAVATASGNLTTFIPLSGAAVAIGAASGSLTTGIPLSAAAIATALASGSLVAQIKLNGTALTQAAASAGLTSAILLAGSAQGQATASGTLAADPGSMAGNAQAQATAVATLTTSIRLSGAAAAQAGVSGILTTNISLSGAALAQAIATGTLAVPILLAGAAHGVATATGNLTAPSSPATAVHFRVNSSVERLTKIACMAQRLTQARVSAQRLTTIKHEVKHV